MHVFYMEFRACEITAWTTEFHTDFHRVVDEVVEQQYKILDSLCRHSKEFAFNPFVEIEAPDNERAIEVFDYLMSRFALETFKPNEYSHGSFEFRLCCKPIIDTRSCDLTHRKREMPLGLCC